MQELNLLDSRAIKKIHFIGIGGISMSGLAEILIDLGYKVSGSDLRMSNITEKLEVMGAKIFQGQSEKNISDPDLVVYTAAVKEDNPELIKARSLNIPVIERAVLLGQIMKKYPYSIAISGTHGKTTTTSMITMIIMEAGLNPTVHIGGELSAIGGNTKIGGSKYFITEACEYVESFLKFYPYLAVILNVEADHLDYFRDLDHIMEAFYKFASLVPRDGYVVVCADDRNAMTVVDRVSCNKITYGIKSSEADWSARNIEFDDSGCASYTIVKSGEELSQIKLNVPGLHNVSNSLAAIAACYTLGCDLESAKRGLQKFYGTHRRFELKGIVNSIKVVDDYAHHPTEVKSTLKAARNSGSSRIWCVFQPHTYTRTKALLDDFSEAFGDADEIVISDIYAAREVDKGEIHASTLADRIKEKGKNVKYIHSFEAIAEHLSKNAAPGDLVITMGAGDIYKVGEMLLVKK